MLLYVERTTKAANNSTQPSRWHDQCISELLISVKTTSPQHHCWPKLTWHKLHGFGNTIWVWMPCICSSMSLHTHTHTQREGKDLDFPDESFPCRISKCKNKHLFLKSYNAFLRRNVLWQILTLFAHKYYYIVCIVWVGGSVQKTANANSYISL